MFDRYHCIKQLFHAKIERNCQDFAKTHASKMARRMTAFWVNYNLIMTSQYNVKSNTRYVMTSSIAKDHVTSINKSIVLKASAHVNHIDTRPSLRACMLISCGMGIYAII